MFDFREIPIDQINPPLFLLRPVRKSTVEYNELLDSIRNNGLWQPILVRPKNEFYEVVDGFYRFTCNKQLNMQTVPCVVRELTDDEVLCVQIQCNAVRLETQPIEFADHIATILSRDEDLTIAKLSILINKSIRWIRNTLNLQHLSPECQELLKRGGIPLTSAYELGRLPKKLQLSLIDLAQQLSVKQFVQVVRQTLKELREGIHRKKLGEWTYRDKPVPYLRKYFDIKAEWENPRAAANVLRKTKADNPVEAWQAALAWVLNMDPDGRSGQLRAITNRQNEAEEAKKRRKEDRQKLKELKQQKKFILETEEQENDK